MSHPSRVHSTLLVALVFLTLAWFPSCRCGTDPEIPEPPPSGVAGLPESYPETAKSAAEDLAEYLPEDTDAAAFVASYASLVALTDSIKAWGFVDGAELDKGFGQLERYHGINPGRADSYVTNGLPLTGSLAIGRRDDSWFLVTEVGDRAGFDGFIDGLINEEYGRPRPHKSDHGGIELTSINVLKRDLLTVAYIDSVAILVAGERLVEEAPPSIEAMKSLLDAQKKVTLSKSESFKDMMGRLGELGPVMVYTSEQELAREILAPLLEIDEDLGKLVDERVVKSVDAFGVALGAGEESITIKAFAAMPAEKLSKTLTLATPDPAEVGPLRRFLDEDVTGLIRLTFNPKEGEAAILSLLDEKGQKKWTKLRDKSLSPLMLSFPEQVLYNLSGQVFVTVFEVDGERLRPTEDLTSLLRSGVDGVAYLTLKDPAKSDSYFNAVSMFQPIISELVPGDVVRFGDKDGILVVTVMDGRTEALKIAYHNGTIALMTPRPEIVERVIAKMKLEPTATGAAPRVDQALLRDGATWGLSIEMGEVLKLLSARYDVVKLQINRFLSPLRRASVRTDFSDDGVALELQLQISSLENIAADEVEESEATE